RSPLPEPRAKVPSSSPKPGNILSSQGVARQSLSMPCVCLRHAARRQSGPLWQPGLEGAAGLPFPRIHLFPRSEQPTFSLLLGLMSSAIFCFQGRRSRAAEICEGANNLSSILVVSSSPRAGSSISTRLATDLAGRLSASRPGAKIVRRDLVEAPLPHVDG